MTFLLAKRPAETGAGALGSGPEARRLRLLPTGDGWSLVTRDGRLVFSALGLSGRRSCLQFALDKGVVALAT
jgi:hypothetical protein